MKEYSHVTWNFLPTDEEAWPRVVISFDDCPDETSEEQS